MQNLQNSIIAVGIVGPEGVGGIALGCFIGFFVGQMLAAAVTMEDITVKKRIAYVSGILAIAIAGAVLTFIGDSAEAKWMYPVGLLMGFMATHLGIQIDKVVQYVSRPSKGRKVHAIFAMIELGIILLFAISGFIYAALL